MKKGVNAMIGYYTSILTEDTRFCNLSLFVVGLLETEIPNWEINASLHGTYYSRCTYLFTASEYLRIIPQFDTSTYMHASFMPC